MTRASSIAVAVALALSGCGATESTPTGSPTPTQTPPSSTPSASTAASAEPSHGEQAPSEFAGAWEDVTPSELSAAGAWTNKLELADLDLDGDVDILFANGGDYQSPGEPVASGAWRNNGDGTFVDATTEILGEHALLTRVIKVADLNGDTFPDILMGTTYDTQSRLLLGSPAGTWADVTDTHLPAAELSIGDLEFGDVDADGDLDVAIADWGDNGPINDRGGRTALWLNDGSGVFADATDAQMPETLVGFSWDIEVVDVDNDWDLDLAISCKLCPSSLLFENDGTGTFADVTEGRLPAFTNNYEFAPIDLDGDGFLDLVTINDGADTGSGVTEHVFRNDGAGSFEDATAEWWPADANLGWDDNVVVAIDIESDGDADFVIGSLDGADRLLVNDGSGRLSVVLDAFVGEPSSGTLDLAIADLNGDGRPDLVEAQGEVAEDERIYLATEVLAPDTAAPIIRGEMGPRQTVLARVHDNLTPNTSLRWQSIVARWSGGEVPMTWYGEHLFRVTAARRCDADRDLRGRRRGQRDLPSRLMPLRPWPMRTMRPPARPRLLARVSN